jgi:CheY-like chemotaxis protein
MVTARVKVPVVDDDPTIRRLLKRILSHFDCQVELAGNGVEALAVMESARPDLVLLDVAMPEMDGLATLTAMRAAGSPGLTVVSITGVADRASVTRMAELGVADYVLKPINPTVVHKRLGRILARLSPR